MTFRVIKSKMYKEIVSGNWWDLKSYFKSLREDLLSKHKEHLRSNEAVEDSSITSGD